MMTIKYVKALWIIAIFGASFSTVFAWQKPVAVEAVKVCQTKPNMAYRIEVAQLLLDLTSSKYGQAGIAGYADTDPTQARCVSLLKHGKVDLIYLGASEKLLKDFISIQHDIHFGMLGYRVLLIRRQDLAKFANVSSLADLRQFTGGFGSQWGDFKVFERNHLPVVGTAIPSALLAMLNAQRFDYFHRALHEAWVEQEKASEEFPDLVVEPKLALVYDFPVYFFVNRANPLLAKRLLEGFKIARQTNALKNLFIKHYGDLVEKAQLSQRHLIFIDYPTPKGLPLIETEVWFEH